MGILKKFLLIGFGLICIFYFFAFSEPGVKILWLVMNQGEALIQVRGNIIAYRKMNAFYDRYNNGEFHFNDEDLKQLQDFIRHYPDSQLVPKLKAIEALIFRIKQADAEAEARRIEEATARTVYRMNGYSEKLVESRRCKDKCTQDQEIEAKGFAKECTESGGTPYPGLCCDTVCSEPVVSIGTLFARRDYLTLEEETMLQFSTALKGIPRGQYRDFVIELEELDTYNRIFKNFGRFYDNGQNGDILANDGTYTIRVNLKENKLGIFNFRSRLLRPNGTWSFSQNVQIEVQPKNILSKPRSQNMEKILHHPKYGEVVANNILVAVRSGTPAAKVRALANKVKCKIIERAAYNNWVFEADTVEAMDKAIVELRKFPEILSVGPNGVTKGF